MHGISNVDKLGLCLKTMKNSTGFKEDNRLLRDPATFSLPKKLGYAYSAIKEAINHLRVVNPFGESRRE
jgi:hypothetical protein